MEQKEEIFNRVVQTESTSKKSFFRWPLKLAISLMIFFVVINTVKLNLVETEAVVGSIAIDTTSLIVIEVNQNKKVVTISSSSKEEDIFIGTLNMVGKDLEEVLIVVTKTVVNPKEGVPLDFYIYSSDIDHMMMIDDEVQRVMNDEEKRSNHCRTIQVDKSQWEGMMNGHHGNRR